MFHRKHHSRERLRGGPQTRALRISRAARWLAALSLAAGSAGCILTKDLPDPALDIPQGYRAARLTEKDAPPTLDWWRGFRSPELTALMEEAQKVNLDIAVAVSQIAQADAAARIAGAPLLPTLQAAGPGNLGQESYSRVSGSSQNGLSTGGRETVNFSTSLAASYVVDFWGQYRDAAQAAEETAVANRFNREVVALTTLTSVATAYFNVLASQDRLRTAESNVASASRVLDAIKQRFKSGTGTDLDVAQQESVLANQRAAIPPLRQTLQQNINALAILVSRPSESLRIAGGSMNQIAVPKVTPGLPSELLTQRPDIRKQEAMLASATANVGSARAQFFPSISLTGQGGYQSSALTSLIQPHAAFFGMVASVNQPIFDGGAILGNFENAKAVQDQMLQTYRKTVVQAFGDVDNALVAIRETTNKLKLQRDVVAASRRAFQLSERQLQAGTADIVTVLNTQLTLFQAEDALWQAQLARLLAVVSFYQALGGGWEPKMEKSANAF